MAKMQQLSLWDEPRQPDGGTAALGSVPGSAPLLDGAAERDPADSQRGLACNPPTFPPLPSSVSAGVFGLAVTGPVEPDQQEVEALTREHAFELITTLVEVEVLGEALRCGVDPRTGRMPRTTEAEVRLAERLRSELRALRSTYADMLAAFAEGFGFEAERQLDDWVRVQVAGTPAGQPYDPGHPWHYYWAGDGATPLPLDLVPADDNAGPCMEQNLPKNPSKRQARLQELLKLETERLDDDRRRYQEIVANGAEALSQFDREIAYGGNNELAVASTIALKYNHIRLGLGRVRWLKAQLG